MPWHVALGRYFMVYSPGLEPYDIVGKTGQEHSLAMVVHVDYGLLGTGKDCNGKANPGEDEVHYSIDNTTFIVVVRWEVEEKVFTTDPGLNPGDPPIKYGTGRLYFDHGLSKKKQEMLEDIFKVKPVGELAAFGTVRTWLPSAELSDPVKDVPPYTLDPHTGLPTAVGTSEVNISVPPITAKQNSNSINLRPLVDTATQQLTYRLINCEPQFRMGGQNPDLEGVTLASAVSAIGTSKWEDAEFKGFKFPAQLNGQGEIRNFEWQGPDTDKTGHVSLVPRYLRATSVAARENIIGQELLKQITGFEPIGGGD